jgi:hypothetical protein
LTRRLSAAIGSGAFIPNFFLGLTNLLVESGEASRKTPSIYENEAKNNGPPHSANRSLVVFQ